MNFVPRAVAPVARAVAGSGWVFSKSLRSNSTPHRTAKIVDVVAICSYTSNVKTVSIRDAKNRLTELAREVERGAG
jgi:hypothetical protein